MEKLPRMSGAPYRGKTDMLHHGSHEGRLEAQSGLPPQNAGLGLLHSLVENEQKDPNHDGRSLRGHVLSSANEQGQVLAMLSPERAE